MTTIDEVDLSGKEVSDEQLEAASGTVAEAPTSQMQCQQRTMLCVQLLDDA